MIGKTVAHYRILRRLGAGGMGEVFLAEDTRLQRQVALKVLPDEAMDPQTIERFRREGRALAALNHNNIVTIYSVEEENGRHFLTMEYVEGQSLADAIPRRGMPIQRLLELAVPLADALAAAHERGVVHRDLKPSNVMLTSGGQPKILDFGLAKRQEPKGEEADPTAETEVRTQEGVVMGSAPYMSPEQLQGRPLDERTDLFSFGVMLFEMATGRRPFQGHSSAELVSSILRDVAPELNEHRAGLPPDLGRIVGQCLEKERAHRYQSARELVGELQSLRAGQTLAGSTLAGTHAAPATARPERRPLPWKSVVGVALLVAAAAVGWLLRPQPEDGGRQTVAILPFANLTGDPSLDYLGQGLSAGLLTQLGEASGVRAVGRAAAWSGSGSPAQIARQLGVGSLLEGEVQSEGDKLLVDVHLTDAGSQLVLWNERFEGDRDGLIALQREIGRRLVSVLSVPLSRRELDRMARDPTRSFEAYEYFMRGFRELEVSPDEEAAMAAAALFRQALRLDPRFALAHVGLSEALWRQSQLQHSPELLTEAEDAARQALDIDPELPAAQVALARVLRGRGRSSESIVELEEALASHPKPDEALRELALSYEQTGDLGSAEEGLRSAAAIGDDWFNVNVLGKFLARQGRYDEAREQFERAAEAAGDRNTQPRENLATLDLSQGRFDAAVEAFEGLPRPIGDGRLASNIGTAYYYSSRPDKWERAEEHYRLAVELSPRRDVYHGNLGDLYWQLGREEEARESYRIARSLVEEQLEANPENPQLLLRRAELEAKAGECEPAVRHAGQLVRSPPQTGPKSYQLAKVFALCGETRAAVDALSVARRLGSAPADLLGQEREFRSLASDPEFRELLD